jgi:hypothetical protein
MLGRLREVVRSRPALFGVLGAALLLVGGSWYQALITPPYRFIDEQAHAGYVLAIQDGTLPTIDTPIDQEAGGPALRTRLVNEPERRRHVWVANNPPLTYVLAAGPSTVTRALGLPGGPLLGLRFVNVAAVAGAVVLSYLLGRDLAGGDERVGIVTAGLVAVTPHLGFVASLGFNDGVSLLATTGVLLALARVCGAGTTAPYRAVIALGVWSGIAAATRPMAMAMALVAAVIGLMVTWWRRSVPLPRTIAWLAGPAVVLAAWSYVLNIVRYGDPTGSEAIFEKFGRQPGESLWSTLTTKGTWEYALRTVTTRRLELGLPGDERWWYEAVLFVLAVSVVATVGLVVTSAVRGRGGPAAEGRRSTEAPLAWAAVGATSLVPVLLTAQHLAGGGAMHPRYLLPMLPALMAAVAFAAVRLLGRWAGVVLVGALAVLAFVQTRASARWLAENPSGPPGSELVTAYGSELVRAAGLGVAALGLVLVVGALVAIPDRT